MQDKELLRTWLKTKRLKMPKAEVEKFSGIIQQKLIDFVNWQNLKSVHCYQEIESLNEVSTLKIREFIRTNYPDIHLSLQSQDDQPASENFDLIIVPTLAFDKFGYRLGWGGGFYDQFLAGQPQALKVGLCFRSGFIPQLPHEAHDIRLDKVITEV